MDRILQIVAHSFAQFAIGLAMSLAGFGRARDRRQSRKGRRWLLPTSAVVQPASRSSYTKVTLERESGMPFICKPWFAGIWQVIRLARFGMQTGLAT